MGDNKKSLKLKQCGKFIDSARGWLRTFSEEYSFNAGRWIGRRGGGGEERGTTAVAIVSDPTEEQQQKRQHSSSSSGSLPVVRPPRPQGCQRDALRPAFWERAAGEAAQVCHTNRQALAPKVWIKVFISQERLDLRQRCSVPHMPHLLMKGNTCLTCLRKAMYLRLKRGSKARVVHHKNAVIDTNSLKRGSGPPKV